MEQFGDVSAAANFSAVNLGYSMLKKQVTNIIAVYTT